MRFSKGAGENKLSFPLDAAQIRALSPCSLVSPRIGKSHGITMPPALCNDAGRADALREVEKVREDVKGKTFPMWFMRKYYPDDWGSFPEEIPALLADEGLHFSRPEGLADVVHMDNPVDLGRAMLRWLINQGATPKGASTISYDFLGAVPESMAGMAREVDNALAKAFEVKYYYGLPRPEEVHGSKDITHYDEGSPSHPTFPAGHGAAAFASAIYFLEEWALTDEQKKALFDAAYIWSMARTFAGVHFAVDNLTFAPRRSEV